MKILQHSLILLAAALLGACGHVNDFFLGADNTEPPSKLTRFEPDLFMTPEWKMHVGKGSNGEYLNLQPMMVGDVIYSVDAKGVLMAVDRNTGNLVWKKKLKAPVSSGPVVADNAIAVGTRDARLLVLDQSNGEERWQADVDNEVLAKPVIHGGKVIAKTVDGKLYAYSLANGEKIWRYNHGSPTVILRAASQPVVSDDMVVVGFSDGKLVGLGPDTGELKWVRIIALPTGSSIVDRMVDIDADPVIENDVIFVSTYQGQIMAMNINTGNTLWSHDMSSFTGMAVDNQSLYISDAQDHVWAFDKKTGAVIWRQKDLQARGLTEPVLMGNAVVVADAEGFVHWLSREDGHFVTRIRASKNTIASRPQVRGDKLYVLTENGELRAFSELADKKQFS